MSAATPSHVHQSTSLAHPGAGRATRAPGSVRWTFAGWLVRSGARRIVAMCLTVLFALSCAEALIADICDGDEGSSGVATVAAGAVAQDATAEGAVSAGMPAAHLDDSTSDHVPASDRPHGVHVCHCTHAHGGTLTLSTNVAAVTVPASEAHDPRSDRVPPSPALEPQLRPPASTLVA